MNEQEKQALLHHEAMQKRQAKSQHSGGFSEAIDDIRHQVVEEPYWLRPEGRETTNDIQPKVRDFYETPDAQERIDTREEHSPGDVQNAVESFYDIKMDGNEKDSGKSSDKDTAKEVEQPEPEREIGL